MNVLTFEFHHLDQKAFAGKQYSSQLFYSSNLLRRDVRILPACLPLLSLKRSDQRAAAAAAL